MAFVATVGNCFSALMTGIFQFLVYLCLLAALTADPPGRKLVFVFTQVTFSAKGI